MNALVTVASRRLLLMHGMSITANPPQVFVTRPGSGAADTDPVALARATEQWTGRLG